MSAMHGTDTVECGAGNPDRHADSAAPTLLTIAPLFFSDASGASVYYQLLMRHLAARGVRTCVVGDRERGRFDGTYFSLFPRRSARERRRLRDTLAYAAQNLTYLALPAILARTAPATVLVHSAFYNLPGIFPHVMAGILRRNPGIRFVVDVRDRGLPPGRGAALAGFHRVIACSENVRRHLLAAGIPDGSIDLVPVIQERLDRTSDTMSATCAALGLDGRRFILHAGLLKESKGLELLLEAFVRHVRPNLPDVALVLSGLIKTQNRETLALMDSPGVLHVGSRPRAEVLDLARAAELCVNLSPIEGMPRSSLEPLALGRPALLPPNVPEFAAHCPDFVAAGRDPAAIARQMIGILQRGAAPAYPIERHLPENVVPRYAEILGLD